MNVLDWLRLVSATCRFLSDVVFWVAVVAAVWWVAAMVIWPDSVWPAHRLRRSPRVHRHERGRR